MRTVALLRGAVACLLAGLLHVSGAQTAAPEPQTFLARAREQAAAQQWMSAEATVRLLLSQQPDNPEAQFLLGYVLFGEQRATESLAAYTAGAKLRTPAPDDVLVVASDYILLKDYPDAERWLRYVTDRAPGNATAWYLRGRTAYNQDRAAEAVEAFERCLALRPRDVRAEYNLGLAYERLQRTREAAAAYRAAILWQSGNSVQDSQPYLNLGTLLLSQSKAAEALDPLRHAVAFAPKNPLAQQQLGLALEAAGQDADALAALTRAVALAPEAEQPHFFLARLYRRLGRKTEAAAENATVARLLGSHSETATPNPEGKP